MSCCFITLCVKFEEFHVLAPPEDEVLHCGSISFGRFISTRLEICPLNFKIYGYIRYINLLRSNTQCQQKWKIICVNDLHLGVGPTFNKFILLPTGWPSTNFLSKSAKSFFIFWGTKQEKKTKKQPTNKPKLGSERGKHCTGIGVVTNKDQHQIGRCHLAALHQTAAAFEEFVVSLA